MATTHAGLGPLSPDELRAYRRAGEADRVWFERRPGRRFRLRLATAVERKALTGHDGFARHLLVRSFPWFGGHVRMRHPVHWSIPGELPDSDDVLARLAGGAVFTSQEGRA